MPMAEKIAEIRDESRECRPQDSASRKRLVRKPGRDWSQQLRRTFQGIFLALNVYLGLQFYLFVRQYESGGNGLRVPRPAGVEGWLPIAGMMNLKYFLAFRM